MFAFYYIRHAEPIYNPDSLTDRGELQAEALVTRLRESKIDEVYVSSSRRAQQTAAPFLSYSGITPTVCDWADERIAGHEFRPIDPETGKKNWFFEIPLFREAFLSPEVLALGSRWYEHPVFADTGVADGYRRITAESDRFFSSVGLDHDRERQIYLPNERFQAEKNVAFFAHAGFGMEFLPILLDMPFPYYALHFTQLGLSSLTVIRFTPLSGGYVPRLLTYSNDAHLFRAGLRPYHWAAKF